MNTKYPKYPSFELIVMRKPKLAMLFTKWRVKVKVACVAGGIREHKGGSLKYRLPKN